MSGGRPLLFFRSMCFLPQRAVAPRRLEQVLVEHPEDLLAFVLPAAPSDILRLSGLDLRISIGIQASPLILAVRAHHEEVSAAQLFSVRPKSWFMESGAFFHRVIPREQDIRVGRIESDPALVRLRWPRPLAAIRAIFYSNCTSTHRPKGVKMV